MSQVDELYEFDELEDVDVDVGGDDAPDVIVESNYVSKKELPRYKIYVGGSKTYRNYKVVEEELTKIVNSAKRQYPNGVVIEFVSDGEKKGATKLAERYAVRCDYNVVKFKANWKNTRGKPKEEIMRKDGKRIWRMAGVQRDKIMYKYCDIAVLFSQGAQTTGMLIGKVSKSGVKMLIVVTNPHTGFVQRRFTKASEYFGFVKGFMTQVTLEAKQKKRNRRDFWTKKNFYGF